MDKHTDIKVDYSNSKRKGLWHGIPTILSAQAVSIITIMVLAIVIPLNKTPQNFKTNANEKTASVI
jgi:hypothetical protein